MARRFPTSAETGDLWNRIWFTLGALAIYRLGTFVLLPGIDPQIYDMADVMFSEGGLPRFSIFTLGIGPYVVIAFWALILSVGWRRVAKLKQRGAAGRRALGRCILVGTVVIAALEAYGLAVGLEESGVGARSPIIIDPGHSSAQPP